MTDSDEVLGVLTGQVPVRSMPIAGDGLDHDHENVCCRHHDTHADPHRGCSQA